MLWIKGKLRFSDGRWEIMFYLLNFALKHMGSKDYWWCYLTLVKNHAGRFAETG